MGISERISTLMEQKGLSRYKLAKLSNVPYTTLIKVLDGTTKNPQIETLNAIAEVLGVSVDRLSGNSIVSLLEDRLKISGVSLQEFADKIDVKVEYLQNIENLIPVAADYEIMDRIGKELYISSQVLRSLLARQEPPTYTGEAHNEVYSVRENPASYQVTSSQHHEAPEWATPKDVRDFKKMLEEDAPIMFDGVPIEGEDKERVLQIMEAIFWDAKKKNKRKPIEE
jgi:transcriptional regulator with XRE-family HTH domain